MKRIIVMLTLTAGIFLLSGCYNQGYNTIGNATNVAAWTSYAWVENTVVSNRKTTFLGYDQSGYKWYKLSSCDFNPVISQVQSRVVFFKGNNGNLFNVQVGGTQVLYCHSEQIPPLMTMPWTVTTGNYLIQGTGGPNYEFVVDGWNLLDWAQGTTPGGC